MERKTAGLMANKSKNKLNQQQAVKERSRVPNVRNPFQTGHAQGS
jgi:hypothetical protein